MADPSFFDSFFDDVEKENGAPVFLHRWGIKKVRFQDKVYVVSMSSQEREEAKRAGQERKEIERLEDTMGDMALRYCVGHGFTTCTPVQGCRGCITIPVGSGFYCECRG
jgi:hypothetical protein